MKVLINTPDISILGGVANHYKGLKNYWSENVFYNFIAGRKKLPGEIFFIFDLIKFIIKCLIIRPDLIVLNPSLGKTAIWRDSWYLRISSFFRIKTIVFFHGWGKDQEIKISNSPSKFVATFNKADLFLVLASDFKEKLKDWGISKPIKLTTTKVDDSLLKNYEVKSKNYGNTLLFLARVEKEKGIFVALKAFRKIRKFKPQARLVIAGDGRALKDAKKFVNENKIQNVHFEGFVSGRKLINVFKEADLYLLPTAHGEGMPTSVLEAMAFGLPIISRPVGGMGDFFEEGRMGYLLKSLEPIDFCNKTISLLNNKVLMEEIGLYNQIYAKKNFMASEVAKNMEEVFKQVLNRE